MDEVNYSVAGKPAAYEELSNPLLGQGYLIVMKGEEEAIRTKMAMSDAELYGWETSEHITEFGVTSWNKAGPHGRSKMKSSDSGM